MVLHHFPLVIRRLKSLIRPRSIIFLMKTVLLLIVIAVLINAQNEFPPGFQPPQSSSTPEPVQTATLAVAQVTQMSAQTSRVSAGGQTPISTQTLKTPVLSASAAADSSLTEIVYKKALTRVAAAGLGGSQGSVSSDGFDTARNVFSELASLGGSCCNNCNKICGLTFKSPQAGTYMINMNNGAYLYMAAGASSNASSIFTIGQNADCTWYIQNGGAYVSAANSAATNSGAWVGFRNTIGLNERWYIEKHDEHVHIQSAQLRGYYLTIDVYGIVRCAEGSAAIFMAEYHPCDKTFGWV